MTRGKPVTKLSQELTDEIIRLRDAGMKFKDIAGKVGISKVAVFKRYYRAKGMCKIVRTSSGNPDYRKIKHD